MFNIILFVCYHYDTNNIHVVAISNHQAATIRDVWQNIQYSALQRVSNPAPRSDRESSQDLKAAFPYTT